MKLTKYSISTAWWFYKI